MPSINEALNSKPPLGATLASGVQALSANQQIDFSLYRKYVFPLDGMVYWLKVPSGTSTGMGIQPMPGLASATTEPGETIQVVPGGITAVAGITIANPFSAMDQGLSAAEPLFVDLTGPATCYVSATTIALQPGDSLTLPDIDYAGNVSQPLPNLARGAWVCASSGGHRFTAVVLKSVTSVTLPTDVSVMGSFHYDSAIDQREDATVDSNTVIFTSLEEIQEFNNMGPDYLYIAHYRALTFAFSSRGRLYEQADLYHYMGKALYSVNATQIIDDPDTFNPSLVVSNSLPIWLNMPSYVPPYYDGFLCPLPLFPSFLVTDNLEPPFGSVHIDKTEVLHTAPIYGPNWEQWQVCRDTVRVTLYGADALMAATFLSFVLQYSRDWDFIGMANMPNVSDEKHHQPEMQILSQRKRVEFTVNYLEAISRAQARQFILQTKMQFFQQWLTGDP
jgi:hypothetical protein